MLEGGGRRGCWRQGQEGLLEEGWGGAGGVTGGGLKGGRRRCWREGQEGLLEGGWRGAGGGLEGGWRGAGEGDGGEAWGPGGGRGRGHDGERGLMEYCSCLK